MFYLVQLSFVNNDGIFNPLTVRQYEVKIIYFDRCQQRAKQCRYLSKQVVFTVITVQLRNGIGMYCRFYCMHVYNTYVYKSVNLMLKGKRYLNDM